MKSVDPGILPQSHCSTFQPSEFARKNLIYMTWCGHYYCTGQYYMDRDSYPEALLLFVRNGEMDVKYNNKAYTIHKGDVLLLDCVNPHYYRSHDGTEFVYIHFDGGNSHALVDYVIELNGGPVFRQDENMEIGKELYETALIHEKGTVQPPLYISTWITQLLYKLSLSAVPPIEENAPISEAIRYILAHVGEPITLDDLISTDKLQSVLSIASVQEANRLLPLRVHHQHASGKSTAPADAQPKIRGRNRV